MERTSIQKIIRLWLGRQTRQRDEQALKTWLVSSKDADEKREACFGEWQQMNVAGDPKATREALSRFQERREYAAPPSGSVPYIIIIPATPSLPS